ncbi:MAG: hypothetical protein HGA75_13375 [Thiobacillus sp.]|nr:hypothetical protein [Thiobacillus sp.]
MTQIGEAVMVAGIGAGISKCPFDEPEPPDDPYEEDEDYEWDDTVTMSSAQDNSSIRLGNNLTSGSPGSEGSWNVLGGDPPRYRAAREDTRRLPHQPKVMVQGKAYPYTVAAHHLIPGNGSLYDSQLYKSYMRKGGKMKLTEPKAKTFTVNRNIGYNVNGSHNGVWLPGSYAIRAGVHPSKATWSELNADPLHADWCLAYIAAATKITGMQFHDTHVRYYGNVKKILDKLVVKLIKHQQICKTCAGKTESPPPYVIKSKLYRLSAHLRSKLARGPRYWRTRDAWMTSDQVQALFAQSVARAGFMKVYDQA